MIAPLPGVFPLYVGTEGDCHGLCAIIGTEIPPPLHGFSVLHACKYPCHANATGLPPRSDPRYLVHRLTPEHLTLNMIDPPAPLFSLELFTRALDFLDERLPVGPVLVHCNQGLSRAPSLALVWIEKRMTLREGRAATYAEARDGFVVLYPTYAPGPGLVTFLTEHWQEIG